MSIWQQVSVHIAENSSAYIALALAMGLMSVCVMMVLLVRVNASMRPFKRLSAEGDSPSDVLPAVVRSVENTESYVTQLAEQLNAFLAESRSFIRHVGLVRYDAFDDIGGTQSFSLCFLDADRNGALVTYLTGKNSTRSYAVAIENGTAFRDLSDEEIRAMNQAMEAEPVPQA